MNNTDQQFDVNICLVILSTDIPKNKKLILSTDPNQLILPQFKLDTNQAKNINQSIINYLHDKVVVSPLELMPSLLSINSNSLPKELIKDNQLNVVYGVVIVLNNNINNVYWQEFDFVLPHPYSNLLFEVVHSLS